MWLTACSSSSEPQLAPDPPELPDPASLSFDISFFQKHYFRPAAPPGVVGLAHNSHFQEAAIRAFLIGTPIQGIFGAMKRGLLGAEDAAPVYEQGEHRWYFSARPDGIDLDFILSAVSSPLGEDVNIHWQLRETNGRTWLSGDQASQARGTWVVYNRFMEDPLPQFDLAWELNGEGGRVTAVTVLEGSPMYTLDYVWTEFGRTMTHITTTGDRTELGWDEETLEGRMEAFDFHQGIEACWTFQLKDGYCRSESE